MKKVRGVVVGLGYWGPNIVRNFLKIPSVEIVAACDTSRTARNAFSSHFPSIPTASTLDTFLQDPSVDFISIATPLSTHFQLAKKSLLAHKHVLLEKPFTQTSREAEELLRIQKTTKTILMVGHTFVYSESVKKIKNLISGKAMGDLSYYDSTRINLGRFQSDTNVIWDLATHDFSILDQLLPYKPLAVQAMGSFPVFKKKYEIAHVFLSYQNNFTAHIHVSWLSPVKVRTIMIGGTNKMIRYDDIEPSEKVKVYNKSVSIKTEDITPFSPAYRSGSISIPHIQQKEALLTELEHFISCIKSGKNPITDAESGLRVVKILEATDKSLQTNKAVRVI